MAIKYVVRGAQAHCNQGSCPSRLNLPRSHGVYVNEKPVLIDTDREPNANIMPFGDCRATSGPCHPAPAPTWMETKTDAQISGRPAVLTKSFLSCLQGGLITLDTDGQEG